MATSLDTKCPTCHAEAGQKCQTIYYIRQEDGTYAEKGKPARTHKARVSPAG